MALKDWMIAFNNAKTMEANGEEGLELIAEYERVLSKLGEEPLTEAQENIRKEVYRNLYELYALNGDEAKSEKYRQMSEKQNCVETFPETSLQQLFDGNRFGQISGLVHIAAPHYSDVVGQNLQGHCRQQR